MKHLFIALAMAAVWYSAILTIYAEEEIGEEYVVRILEGGAKKAAASAPLGIAFIIESPRLSVGTGPTKRQATQKEEEDRKEALSKRLLPVGRALESDALGGLRFAVSVYPMARTRNNDAEREAMKVAAEIKQFLTRYFAISAERLITRTSAATMTGNDMAAETASVPRWRVEITRLE